MAESKFLKFQDVDRDGLIDVCDDDLTTPELPCKGPCTPDPDDIIPNWRRQSFTEPFLNTRICHFQATKVTPYNSTSDPQLIIQSREDRTVDNQIKQSLEDKFEEFELEAINNILDFCPIGARLNNEETRAIVSKAIQYKKYDLAARPNSFLKLLYSVPFDIIYNLADAPEPEEGEEEDETGPGWEKVTYKGDTIGTDSIRVRKGLNFYSKLLKVSAAIGEGAAYFVDSDGKATHRFFLEDYGDSAVFTSGRLSRMIDELRGFLAARGKSLPDIGPGGNPFSPMFNEKVTKIQFSFKDKKLRVLRVYTEECGNKPSVYNLRSGALRSLVGKDGSETYSWNQPTLVNYFMNLSPMARELNSRVEQPWRAFLENYTFPEIKVTHLELGSAGDLQEERLSSCLYNNVRDEINEMGNDVLDSVFGLGDLVAYLYNDTLCRKKLEEVIKDDKKMNRVAPQDPDSPFGREVAAILAKNQRWAKLSADDDRVLRMCINALAPVANGANEFANKISNNIPIQEISKPGKGGPMGMPEGLWKEGFNALKLCGLLDLLFDAMGCLLGGLSLDEALPVIVKKALEAMGIEQFGELFVGLPPEQQEKMDALVKKKISEISQRQSQLASGEEFTTAGAGEGGPIVSTQAKQLAGAAGEAAKTSWKNFVHPWKNPEVIAAERVATNPANIGNGETPIAPPVQDTMKEMAGTDRTILSQLDSVSSREKGKDTPINEIMEAYIDALIEVYSDNLILIIDELGKFPGAELIKNIIAFTPLSCPKPPLFNPGLDDFFKSLDLAFCRKTKEIEIPTLNEPLEIKMKFKDILDPIFVVAKFLAGMIIMIVVNQLLGKICDILTRAVCKALETTGDLVLGLPGALSGAGPSLRDILRENICGEDADDKTLDDALIDLMSIIGLGPAAFADRDKTIAFANDLSLSVTRQEFADALTGNPSEEFLEAADQLLEFVHTDFREALPNKNSIARFAKGIGNFLPLDYREVLISYSNGAPDNDLTPANPSICASPEQREKFKELRCELLSGRATEEDCEKFFCDLRDDDLSDLELISDIQTKGFGPYIADKIPPILSTPGCDDGLLPFEPIQTLDASLGFMGSQLDALENEYLDDMLGTGFTLFGSGDRNFGFLTMALSDTLGNNLRNHHRKSNNLNRYVDFAANTANGGHDSKFAQFKADFGRQEGQYPYYVAEWMKRQFLNAGMDEGDTNKRLRPGFNLINAGGTDLKNSLNFASTNDYIPEKTYGVDLDELGYANIFGKQGISTFTLPDFGYNTVVDGIERNVGEDIAEGILDLAVGGAVIATAGSAGSLAGIGAGGVAAAGTAATGVDELKGSFMKVRRLPRKGNPANPNGYGKGEYDLNGADINLDFRDNALGTREGIMGNNESANVWSYGYEVQCFYSDIELVPGTFEGQVQNRPDDNIRVQIVEKVNYKCNRRFASPLAKQIAAEDSKLPAFDLPDWIESIPLVGFFIENLVKLFMLPFSALFSALLYVSRYGPLARGKVQRFRKYEFIGVDDGLDAFEIDSSVDENKEKALDINNFPNYLNSRVNMSSIPPQVYALADLMGESPDSLKAQYDSTMQQFYRDFAHEIGKSKAGWKYGARYDFLTADDFEYGIEKDGEFISYNDADLENENMVLGISYNEFRLGKERARVVYLDPMVFGGTFSDPAVHVKPLRYDGWWGLVQTFFPDDTACKPHGKNLIDFDEIKQMLERHYSSLEEDTRLYKDVECVRQVPFDRILPRSSKMSLYTLILAAIRIYASTHIIKTIGTFAKIQPKFPDNFSSIYSAYIIEKMEEDFKDAQPAFWEAFNVFKDEEFWYAFLEQAVECYDFLVSVGELDEPVKNGYLQKSADAINNLQTNYAYAYRTKDKRRYTDQFGNKRVQKVPGLIESKFSGDAGFFETLRAYRERKNLEGVKSVEDEAKIILQELVNYELSKMGEKLITNMQLVGFNPEIFDLDYWLFENKCVGSEIMYRGPKIVESPISLPTKQNPDPAGVGATFPGPYFTPGGQFRVANDKNTEDEYGYADEYIGYYHVHLDDDGNEIYMAGAIHNSEAHDVIVPVADQMQIGTIEKTINDYEIGEGDTVAGPPTGIAFTDPVEIIERLVPIGDVPDFETGGTATEDQPFKIEKYISINGVKSSVAAGKSTVLSNPSNSLISEIYPGTLRLVKNNKNQPVGIEGNIGVRHGLAFYYQDKMITSVEVDALDFKINQFQEVQPNSKLLHCLLQKLKHDPKYKLLTSYIFSMKKVTATLAIYNDMGFLASIGEVTTGEGDSQKYLRVTKKSTAFRKADPTVKSDWLQSDDVKNQIKIKPGSRVYIASEEIETDPITGDNANGTYSEAQQDNLGIPPWFDDEIDQPTRLMFDPEGSAITGNEGWQHPKDRPRFTPFSLHWDEWDRELLRNSRARIKKMFRTHYFASTDKPGDKSDKPNGSKIKLRNLKARLFPPPGAGILPWWKRRKMKKNPYNANGGMCDGPDILG
tara:strand:+ start:2797 stop:10221 length:7425 start_codon:yes stop_codon:yes gene_type:complete